MGLLSNLFGQQQPQAQTSMQPQQGGLFSGRLGVLNDPTVALPLAGALMQPGNLGANLGQGFAYAGEGLQARKKLQQEQLQQNATAKWLESQGADAGLVELAKSGAGAQALQLYQAGKKDPLTELQLRKAQLEIGNLEHPKPDYMGAGDGYIFDKTNNKFIAGPDAGKKPPTLVDLYDEKTGQTYKAQYNPQTQQYDRVGGMKAPNGMSIATNPDGTVNITQGGAPKPLTSDQAKNAGFLKRALPSHQIINNLEKEGTSSTNKLLSSDYVPFGNYGLSANAQKFGQAKRDFVNAILRRESGAVISPSEFENADKQYFPQPGDGPEVIAQKRANRENAIEGLRIGSSTIAPTSTAPGELHFDENGNPVQ